MKKPALDSLLRSSSAEREGIGRSSAFLAAPNSAEVYKKNQPKGRNTSDCRPCVWRPHPNVEVLNTTAADTQTLSAPHKVRQHQHRHTRTSNNQLFKKSPAPPPSRERKENRNRRTPRAAVRF